ncbi:MAG: hypothetical protein Q8S54_04765, partial [Bacteroidota bacterium]|nr:hypothetical protein [Bacteroidota bacterium]
HKFLIFIVIVIVIDFNLIYKFSETYATTNIGPEDFLWLALLLILSQLHIEQTGFLSRAPSTGSVRLLRAHRPVQVSKEGSLYYP